MEALMRYDSLNDRGFHDEQSYTVKIETNGDKINIHFVFSDMPQGLSKTSKVSLLILSFEKDEAKSLVAALNGILHHPQLKDQYIEWHNKKTTT